MNELMRPEWWNDLLAQNYDWFWEVGLALMVTAVVAFAWRMIRKKTDATGQQNQQQLG